jgi:hypothetical protein
MSVGETLGVDPRSTRDIGADLRRSLWILGIVLTSLLSSFR